MVNSHLVIDFGLVVKYMRTKVRIWQWHLLTCQRAIKLKYVFF